MKKLLITLGVLSAFHANTQVSVYDCASINSVVTQNEVLAGAYGFYRPCIDFTATNTFLFQSDVHKEIKALEYIDIQEDFHAGPFNSGKGMHFIIGEKALYDIAVMNYPDLNAIQKFKKVEFGIDLEGEIEERIKEFVEPGSFPGLDPLNPYIADDLNPSTSELVVHATFIHPATGTVKERDFFYYHEYERVGQGYGVDVVNVNTGEYGWSDALNDNNDFLMRVRFAPPLPGEWETHVTVTLDGTTTQLPVFAFLVQDNNHPGYVKVHHNNRNLQRGTSIVFPIGHVFPGPYNRAPGGELTGWTPWGDPPDLDPSQNTTVTDWRQFLGDIHKYITGGGKSFKLTQTSYGNLLEFEQLGNYSKRMHYGWEQDKILDMCEEYDVLVNFNLLFQDVIMGYGQNGSPKTPEEGVGYWGDPWDYGNYGPDMQVNPNDYFPTYCYFVPGTLPSNQFLDPVFMNYHKQRTRYYVARYGYSPQIYLWELMSEPLHMDEFDFGTVINPTSPFPIPNKPAQLTQHPGHQVAKDAVNAYHNEISYYMKNDLKDSDHLIGMNIAPFAPDDISYFNLQSASNPLIDVIGYHFYSNRPDKLIEVKDDKNGKNNLSVEVYGSNQEKSEYRRIFEQFLLFQKPIILGEVGHVFSSFSSNCYSNSGNIIDVMTYGFCGVAAMHPWEGYVYGAPGVYDQRQLWSSTIYAERHMNSDKVIPTLDHWNGDWKQGRQIEKVYWSNEERPKELQYYLAQSNESATGYVRNRSYNVHTMRTNDSCLADASMQGFKEPLDNFYSFSYTDGNNSILILPGGDNHLYVKGLQKKTWYEIKWYDFITGNQLPTTYWQETDNKFRMELHFPELTSPQRPILWFSMQKLWFTNANTEGEEDEQEFRQAQLSELDNGSVFQVFPNPFSNEITVRSFIKDTIEIKSVSGVLVGQFPVLAGETTIALPFLSKGIYFVTSTTTGVTLKIIKQ